MLRLNAVGKHRAADGLGQVRRRERAPHIRQELARQRFRPGAGTVCPIVETVSDLPEADPGKAAGDIAVAPAPVTVGEKVLDLRVGVSDIAEREKVQKLLPRLAAVSQRAAGTSGTFWR